ncbi:hypothetical protein AVEN_78578-1 [Araneus ventricosus]|uniref:Uncharacterized protein n=1 Tax=Araneus ventricosus TaxID=182803 RepID=A0A4Y2L9J4_ARAVE|nr:hypothetical protein AVEN_78578-1 [Araneus ventricosus]
MLVDRSAEFSFIFQIGLISGSSSCAFGSHLRPSLFSVAMIWASQKYLFSVLNFFSAFEQGSQPSKQSRRIAHSFHQGFFCVLCTFAENKKFFFSDPVRISFFSGLP